MATKAVDIYYYPLSPPSRAVLMGAKNLGIKFNLKLTDIFAGENKKPEFLKMNPQHTVPTIDDNGYYLHESRAILQYLANAYASDDSLYPKDPKKRGIVDQRLLFDQGTLFKTFLDAYWDVVFFKQPTLDPVKMAKFDEALQTLSGYLTETEFVAGNQLTLADFSVMASLSTAEAFEHDFSKYDHILKYIQRCKREIKGYKELNQDGVEKFAEIAVPLLRQARNRE